MNAVMIIPTGIGCEIGGHAGDATPTAKLLGTCCDKLIFHPNVVNASDINEMPENALYVEGSILDRFLEEKIRLKEVRQNKILVVVNKPYCFETINAVSAARATIGIEADVLELDTPLRMIATKNVNGEASGDVYGVVELIKQVKNYSFDALAIVSVIDCSNEICLDYFKNGGVNPWGGVEARVSKLVANEINKPVAHAPIESQSKETQDEVFYSIVDPRMAAEAVSNCYLHCVFKGLHKAPRVHDGYGVMGLSVRDIDVLISPHGCWDRPHNACFVRGIPIIEVMENKTIYSKKSKVPEHYTTQVENYLEAAGVLISMRAGITLESIRRPLKSTIVLNRK